MGGPAPFGSRTLRPTSMLSLIGAEISRDASAAKSRTKALKRLVEGIRADRLLANRPRVGDRRAVSHHVDAALARTEEAGPRDLDSRLDALIRRVLAEGADPGQPTLAPDLLDPAPCVINRLVERAELLPSDIGAMPNRDLPTHGHAD